MSDRKNNILSFPSIVNGDMSLASLTSKVSCIQYLDDVGIQFTWTGVPVGNFQIQVSADFARDNTTNTVSNPGNWVPLLLSYWNGTAFVTSTTVPTSVGSPIYLDLALLSAPWIRAVYTKTSGTGSLNAVLTAKGL